MYYDITLPILLRNQQTSWSEFEYLPIASILAEQPLLFTTHLRSPGYMYSNGSKISQLDLTQLTGRCHIIKIPDSAKSIELKHILKQKIIPHSKLILKTKVSSKWKKSGQLPEPIAMDTEVALYLADRKLDLLGVDGLDLESSNLTDNSIQKTLLSSNTLILNNLNLDHVPVGEYEICCLPLLIMDSGIAPCRVVIKK